MLSYPIYRNKASVCVEKQIFNNENNENGMALSHWKIFWIDRKDFLMAYGITVFSTRIFQICYLYDIIIA